MEQLGRVRGEHAHGHARGHLHAGGQEAAHEGVAGEGAPGVDALFLPHVRQVPFRILSEKGDPAHPGPSRVVRGAQLVQGAGKVHRRHVLRALPGAYRKEEVRHHGLRHARRGREAAGPLQGEPGGQRPHTLLLRGAGRARTVDLGLLRHAFRGHLHGHRRRQRAARSQDRVGASGRAPAGRLRHRRGVPQPRDP